MNKFIRNYLKKLDGNRCKIVSSTMPGAKSIVNAFELMHIFNLTALGTYIVTTSLPGKIKFIYISTGTIVTVTDHVE